MDSTYQDLVDKAVASFATYKANPPQGCGTSSYCEGYAALLSMGGVRVEEIEAAARWLHTEGGEFFPIPSVFIQAVKQLRGGGMTIEARTELAWQAVRRCLSDLGADASWWPADIGGDTHALYAAKSLDIPKLGRATSEEEKRAIYHEFRRLYRAAVESDRQEDHYAGTFEIRNRALGIELTQPSMFGRSNFSPCPGLPDYTPPKALAAPPERPLEGPHTGPTLTIEDVAVRMSLPPGGKP